VRSVFEDLDLVYQKRMGRGMFICSYDVFFIMLGLVRCLFMVVKVKFSTLVVCNVKVGIL